MDRGNNDIGTGTLVAENIYLSIGQKDILQGAVVKAARGKITGLLGRNGAGKSTMLQAIFGFGKAQECDVFVDGKKVKDPYRIRGLMNYLPQYSLFPGGIPVQRVAKQFGVDFAAITEIFPEFKDHTNTSVEELSGGTERLFSVVVLLLADTRFTLLDEPFSHIMPLHLDRLKDLLLRQKEHKGIIITDHLYKPLLSISDDIYLMKEGRSVFVRNREDLVLHGYLSGLFEE